MSKSPAYDPEIQPNAEEWLELDEVERIALIERFHRRAKIKLPNVKLHASFHMIIENQIAMGIDEVVRAIPRLMSQGLSRHDAVHAVASVLTDQLFDQSNSETTPTPEEIQSQYNAAVERLTADGWYAKFEEEE